MRKGARAAGSSPATANGSGDEVGYLRQAAWCKWRSRKKKCRFKPCCRRSDADDPDKVCTLICVGTAPVMPGRCGSGIGYDAVSTAAFAGSIPVASSKCYELNSSL